MAEYNELDFTGKKYTRWCRLVIDRVIGEAPRFTFVEEEVIEVAGVIKSRKQVGQLSFTYGAGDIITLVDPVTLQPTSTTYPVQALNRLLVSAYMNKAVERDNATP